MVACVDEQNVEVARGIVNYNSLETARIMRKASSEIEKILNVEESELIDRRINLLCYRGKIWQKLSL